MLSILTRLIVIDGGKILADGPRDEVLKHLTDGGRPQRTGSKERSSERADRTARRCICDSPAGASRRRARSSRWRLLAVGSRCQPASTRATRPMRRP